MKKIICGVMILQGLPYLNGATNISYDHAGITYDTTRCADPEITEGFIKYMKPSGDKKYLDVSCGSGNYTIALHNEGLDITGIDISQEMLKKAMIKNENISWIHGDAHQLPFKDNSFDGVYCINAIHHCQNLDIAFKEMCRVLVPGGKLIIFTTFIEQCENQWIGYYFPIVWELGRKIIKSQKILIETLEAVGFKSVMIEKFFVSNRTKDLYVYSGKYRPEIYLDPIVRAGMTPFNMPEYADVIEAGCARLKADIDSGNINDVIAEYESDLGENVYVIATK